MLELRDSSEDNGKGEVELRISGGVEQSRVGRVLALAREHKKELLITFSYCFAFVGLGISLTGFGPTLLELVDLTHSSKEKMGYIFTVKGVGYLAGSMTGRLYDKFDGHKLLFIDVLCAAILFSFIPFITNIWLQAVAWFTVGIFTGGMDAGANTLIVWLWKEKVNPFMQLLHFSFGLGAFLCPVVLAALQEKSLFTQYIALGIPFGVSAFPLLFFPSPKNTSIIVEEELSTMVESPKSEKAKEKLLEDEELKVEENREALEASLHLEDRNGNGKETTDNLPPAKARRLRIEVVVFAGILLLLDVGAEIGFGGWLFTYAVEQLHFSDKDAAYVNAVFWGTFMMGRLFAVGIATVLSAKAMLFGDVFGCSLSLIILILFPNSSLALWLCCILFGVSIASVFPTVISLPQNLGIQITGTDTSWMVVGASAGEMLVPLLVGTLQAKFSMLVLVDVVLLVEILGGITFAILLLRVRYVKGESGSSSWFIGSRKQGTKFTKLNEDSSMSP